MKKLATIILLSVMLQSNKVDAQITLDTSLVAHAGLGYFFYPVQISSTETKYCYVDTATNSFSLYNINFTPFLMHVLLPEPIDPLGRSFRVFYVTRSLFDCDDSTIEYAYAMQTGGGDRRFYIMRTDGTQLFKCDSCIAPYVIGALNGTLIINPVMNTSGGTKLFLYKPTSADSLYIYSLCGHLNENVFDFTNNNPSFITVYPNPANNSLTFQITPPDNSNEYEFIIVDNNAKEMLREKISQFNGNYTVDVSKFSRGAYYYTLCTKNKLFQTAKFILSK